MPEDDNRPELSRRMALKASAASIGTMAGATSIAAAAPDRSYRERIYASHKVLENRGPEAQKEFLQNHGIGVTRQSGTAALRPTNNDGPSTQDSNFSAGDDATFYFSLYTDCDSNGYPDGTYTAEFAWDYDEGEFLDDDPLDVAAITWNKGWDYDDYDDFYYTSHDDVSYRSGTSGEGPAFNVRDVMDQSRTGWWYCGTHIEPIGDYDYDERILAAAYTHTWTVEGEPYIDSVGVSYPPGISISFKDSDDEAREKTIDRDSSGELFRESQSDASSCPGRY